MPACLNDVLLLGQMVLFDGGQHGRICPLQLARGIARLGVRALREQTLRCTQPLFFRRQAHCLPQGTESLIWLLGD